MEAPTKLAIIFNVWDGAELLDGAINCVKNHCELIIIIYQIISNYGEEYDPSLEVYGAISNLNNDKIILELYRPNMYINSTANETNKRNIGLSIAKKNNCTHFLISDVDEYYKEFGELKEQYLLSDKEGSVLRILTYFKKPTLRFLSFDNYYVPFIHRLYENTTVGLHNRYPFYVDPTRRVNCSDVKLIGHRGESMHHFSYVRKNIERKIRNSSAKNNIEKTNILELYNKAAQGDFIEPFFKQHLIEVPNYFNIEI